MFENYMLRINSRLYLYTSIYIVPAYLTPIERTRKTPRKSLCHTLGNLFDFRSDTGVFMQ